MFEELAEQVASAHRRSVRSPLSQDELLGLFSSHATGRDYVLESATEVDMRGVVGRHEANARSHLRRCVNMTAISLPVH